MILWTGEWKESNIALNETCLRVLIRTQYDTTCAYIDLKMDGLMPGVAHHFLQRLSDFFSVLRKQKEFHRVLLYSICELPELARAAILLRKVDFPPRLQRIIAKKTNFKICAVLGIFLKNWIRLAVYLLTRQCFTTPLRGPMACRACCLRLLLLAFGCYGTLGGWRYYTKARILRENWWNADESHCPKSRNNALFSGTCLLGGCPLEGYS